jgi:hypothetical protein
VSPFQPAALQMIAAVLACLSTLELPGALLPTLVTTSLLTALLLLTTTVRLFNASAQLVKLGALLQRAVLLFPRAAPPGTTAEAA